MTVAPMAFAAALSLAIFPTALVADPVTDTPESAPITMTPIGSYDSGVFDESAAEIVAYLPAMKATLVVNSAVGTIDVINTADPTNPEKTGTLEVEGTALAGGGTLPAGSIANSVDVREDGLGVVAV